MGRPKQFEHRITVRLGDEHVEELDQLSRLSELDRHDMVRRLILGGQISRSDALEGLQQIQQVQAERSRLGGLLKLPLTGAVDLSSPVRVASALAHRMETVQWSSLRK